MRPVRQAACFFLLVATAACASSDGDADPSGSGETFLAFPTSFQNYKSWEKFAVAAPVSNDVHTAGPRTEYLNKRPPKQSKAFPVGTIIVKELEDGPEADRKVFAMVKRGGTYNAEGARGWEWFELKNGAGGAVSINWRGLGPPSGEGYGGDKDGGCNTCHGASRDNDFVTSPGLSLINL